MMMDKSEKTKTAAPTASDYLALAEFRYALRRFTLFSEAAATRAGLTPQQHQALLAVKGFGGVDGLAVGELAVKLCLRANSAAELVGRLADIGMIERRADPGDGRKVRVHLSEMAEKRLAALSEIHIRELLAARSELAAMLTSLDAEGGAPPRRKSKKPGWNS